MLQKKYTDAAVKSDFPDNKVSQVYCEIVSCLKRSFLDSVIQPYLSKKGFQSDIKDFLHAIDKQYQRETFSSSPTVLKILLINFIELASG